MSASVTKKEGSKIELEFTVAKERFESALDEAFKKNSSKFKVAGFRNGKVPRDVIEKTYGEGVMYDEAFNIIADEEYGKAINENALEVVSHPEVDIKQIGKDKDLIFTVVVYIKPEISIKKYKGLEIEKVNTNVSDEDVKAALDEIRKKNARIITKEDGTIENTDIANIDFEGFLDGKPFDGGKAEKYDLEIGSGAFIPGFEEQLIGMKVGEKKDITTTFPENYGNADLAGKTTIFKIKVHEIKKKEIAELDDEFAKDVSEFENLKDYTVSVKADLMKSKEVSAKAERETKTIDKLVENVVVDIPEPMIEHEIEHMIGDFEQNLAYQGLTLDKYMEILNMKEDDLKAQFRDNAIKDIKLKLALEYIQKAENISAADEDIDNKIVELSKAYGKEDEVESLKTNPNIREYMNAQLRQEKVLEFLVSNAIEK